MTGKRGMRSINGLRLSRSLAAAGASLLFVVACAGTGDEFPMRQPTVALTGVEAGEVSLTGQEVSLRFEVRNPNAFPLPIRGLRYHLRINDQSFAGGESQGRIDVPADGVGRFAVTVELDLMRSGMQVASLLRSGVEDRLDYDLHGDFSVDIPGAPSIGFTSSGTVSLQSGLR